MVWMALQVFVFQNILSKVCGMTVLCIFGNGRSVLGGPL